MPALRNADLQRALSFVAELGELEDLEAVRGAMLPALRRLLPADSVTYTEIDGRTGEAGWWTDPADVGERADLEPFVEHLDQHPVARHHARKGGSQAVQFADFLTRRELHALELYNDFYRPLDVEHQMAIAIDAPNGVSIPISLQRGERAFGERTRALLELLHPHLTNLYRRLDLLETMRQALAALDEPGLQDPPALIVLTRDGRIDFATARATRWLERYFDGTDDGVDRLPDELARWVAGRVKAGPRSHEPLTVKRPGMNLSVRCLATTGRHSPIHGRDRYTLLLEQRRERPNPDTLRQLGLTRREVQVLCRVAAGGTNADIARELYISPRTVQKHLEKIFGKLGVRTRTAAVARALGAEPSNATAV